MKLLIAVAFVCLWAWCGMAGAVTVIPAGGTLTIGGTAAEPNGSNKQGGYIVFEPGSTLVLTQINGSATIWATLVATNGDAYLRADMPRDRQPSIQGHVFAYGAGSLTFSGVNSVRLGHSQYFPVCNLANLHADAQFSTFAINSCTLMAFPQDPSFPTFISSEADIHLMGDADMLAGDELAVPRGKVSLCNSTAVPAGKTVRVSGSGSVMVQPLRFTFAGAACPEACSSLGNLTVPDTNALTLACSLASAGRPLVITNAVPVTLAGTVSGNGCLELAGSAEVTLAAANPDAQQTIVPAVDDVALVLDNAQAAAHMKVSPNAAMTIRGGEGLPAVALEEVLATEESAPCTFLAAANQTVTVAAAAGNLAAGGAGVDAGSAVTFGMLAPGAQVLDEGTATVRYGSSETPPEGCVTATLSDGRSLVALPVAGAIDAASLAAKRNNNWPILCYDVVDGGTVVSGSDAVTLRTPQASTVTLKTDGGETFAVAGEGTFAVTNRSSLVDQVAYWYDFSRPETCFRIGEGTTDEFLGRELSEGVPFIERVVDWRQPEAHYSLWNRRLYKSEVSFECVEMVYPVRLLDGPDGLGYLSMDSAGGSRRLPFAPPSGYNTMASVAAQLVVMVFGSQKGGGYALVATTEGALGRSGTKATSGITTNTLHDIWLDGVKVADSAAQRLNGGWQVVSIALDGLHFSGLGMLKDTSGNRGGQQYGEVLVFTNAVSTRVRLQAEQYLAKKWGLIDQYAPAAQAELAELTRGIVCRVKAAGAPTLVGDGRTLEVSGAFSGTVKLNGGSLAVPERRLPYTEAEIPSANRLYWADPDDAGAVLRYADLQPGDAAQRPDEVRALKDKALRDFAVGQP
ncbi:MAG: hypothetical protein MJ240_10765, partial [Kiritimatiellae bacterium]|nr:hypothetical protein [Kiritimatiellia bacterium]